MASQSSQIEQRQPQEAPTSLKPTPAEILIAQYQLLEERRKYFGNQFMQTIGGVGAIFTILIGQLGGKPENRPLLRASFLFGGIAFLLLAFLAYRLGVSAHQKTYFSGPRPKTVCELPSFAVSVADSLSSCRALVERGVLR
jgi:hypothetical protein